MLQPTALRWPRRTLAALFGADPRSLAAFRIVLALLVLADLADRAASLGAHYTDAGVLPRDVLLRDIASPHYLSLNLLGGGWAAQAALFGLAAAAALALLVGWRTRRMTAVVWALVVSIQNRNPLLLNGADVLLRMLLLWSIFAPLGARWSLDSARQAARAAPRFGLGALALWAQLAMLYGFAALLKTGPEWRSDGTALYYALSLEQYATPLGTWLLGFPELLRLLTFGVFWFEALVPLLLFSPYRTALLRTVAILGCVLLHLGIGLTLSLGAFPWIASLGMVCFVPAAVWDRLPDPGQVARRLVAAVRQRATGITRRSAAPAAYLEPGGMSPDVLAPVVARPAAWWPRLYRPAAGPPRAPEPASATTAPPTRLTRRGAAVLGNVLLGALLGYVLWWNLATVSRLNVPFPPTAPAMLLRLDQEWSMFAPYPLKDDGWFVIPGQLGGGTQLDLVGVTRGDLVSQPAVSWEKPASVEQTYRNERWRKYLMSIWLRQYSGQRAHFSQYLCAAWNARHGGAERLERFEIFYMFEPTLPDYRQAVPERILLWEQACS